MDLSSLRFDEGHTWVRDDGKELIVGVTDYAQKQLGDIVFLELPEAGTTVARDDPFGSIESAKAIEDLVSPISGTITRRNDELMDSPETINDDAYGEGWMIAVDPDEDTDLESLLTHEQYLNYCEELDSDDTDDDDDELDEDLDDDLFFDDEEE